MNPAAGQGASGWIEAAMDSLLSGSLWLELVNVLMMAIVTWVVLTTTGTVQETLFILFGAPVIYTAIVHGIKQGVILATGAGIVITIGRWEEILLVWNLHQWDVLFIESVSIPLFYLVFCLAIGYVFLRERRSKTNYRMLVEQLTRSTEELAVANEANRVLFTSIIQALANAIDAKDPYTRGHSERVTRYSMEIAKELHLPQEEMQRVLFGAILHDIGKIGVPGELLRKPGQLTKEEYTEVCKHPGTGTNILASIPAMEPVLPLVYHHHERYGGGGYPAGVEGDGIPIGARIIAVADAFDAMTSQRNYRRALSPQEALAELERCSGSQFDPRMVAAFVKVMSNGKGQRLEWRDARTIFH